MKTIKMKMKVNIKMKLTICSSRLDRRILLQPTEGQLVGGSKTVAPLRHGDAGPSSRSHGDGKAKSESSRRGAMAWSDPGMRLESATMALQNACEHGLLVDDLGSVMLPLDIVLESKEGCPREVQLRSEWVPEVEGCEAWDDDQLRTYIRQFAETTWHYS